MLKQKVKVKDVMWVIVIIAIGLSLARARGGGMGVCWGVFVVPSFARAHGIVSRAQATGQSVSGFRKFAAFTASVAFFLTVYVVACTSYAIFCVAGLLLSVPFVKTELGESDALANALPIGIGVGIVGASATVAFMVWMFWKRDFWTMIWSLTIRTGRRLFLWRRN